MRRIKIAQVGVGHDHAWQTWHSLVKNAERFDVLGIAPLEGEQIGELYPDAKRLTLDELLAMPDLDAVCIECGELQATQTAMLFAERGVTIHLDKPGSPDEKAFVRLVRKLEQDNTPFQMGYMYRYNPIIRRAIQMVKANELGTIFSVEAQMSICYDDAKKAWLRRFPGGMMYFLGCHMVDLILLMQGLPEAVLPCNRHISLDMEEPVTDLGCALLQYPNGVSYVKSCACEVNGASRRQLVICGSKGSIEIRPLEIYADKFTVSTPASATLLKNDPPAWKDGSEQWKTWPADRYDTMMLTFADMVCGVCPMPYSYQYEIDLMHVLQLCCADNPCRTSNRKDNER